MMRHVTLVAPVLPFRGGIARHSTALAFGLRRMGGVKLEVESFTRLFPRFLYPGEREQDNSTPPSGLNPRFDIDGMNPLTWRAAVRRIVGSGAKSAILPVWTFAVGPVMGTLARMLTHHGIEVVMVVHNVHDHEAAPWKRLLSDWQLRGGTRYVTHSEDLARQLRVVVGERPINISPHPAYNDFPAPRGALPRERALELLSFGLVRPYKGIDLALEGLAKSGLKDVRLTIAGEMRQDPAQLGALAETLGVKARIEFRSGYVDDQLAAELFARCDAVVAPYRTVTGSGVAALARHYARPVIASDLPGLAAHVEHGKTGWLFPAGDTDALSHLLACDVDRIRTSAMSRQLAATARTDEWMAFAETIVAHAPG